MNANAHTPETVGVEAGFNIPDPQSLPSLKGKVSDEEWRLRWLAGFPVEDRVSRMPWVIERFRVTHILRYAPGYHYVVLAPTAELEDDGVRDAE